MKDIMKKLLLVLILSVSLPAFAENAADIDFGPFSCISKVDSRVHEKYVNGNSKGSYYGCSGDNVRFRIYTVSIIANGDTVFSALKLGDCNEDEEIVEKKARIVLDSLRTQRVCR